MKSESINLEPPPVIEADSIDVTPPTDGAPPPGFTMIPPGPVDVKADIDLALVGDEQAVVVTLSTRQGIAYYFFGIEGAATLGRALLRASRTAMAQEDTKPKLIVPKKGLVIP